MARSPWRRAKRDPRRLPMTEAKAAGTAIREARSEEIADDRGEGGRHGYPVDDRAGGEERDERGDIRRGIDDLRQPCALYGRKAKRGESKGQEHPGTGSVEAIIEAAQEREQGREDDKRPSSDRKPPSRPRPHDRQQGKDGKRNKEHVREDLGRMPQGDPRADMRADDREDRGEDGKRPADHAAPRV